MDSRTNQNIKGGVIAAFRRKGYTTRRMAAANFRPKWEDTCTDHTQKIPQQPQKVRSWNGLGYI